jgi:DNA-directed RNA polymerase subunit RPC12/RpoP
MSEGVQFWLDNRLSEGIKVAELEEQLLVEYREKYYVVVDGVAKMKGSKPLHYSKLSIPTAWRMSMSGVPTPQTEPAVAVADETPADGGSRGSETGEKVPNVSPSGDGVASSATAKAAERSPLPVKAKPVKPAGKLEPLQLAQEFVEAKCPYCGHKNEIMMDRGRRTKPFFVPCDKCNEEFGVKLVQVLVYQAQVAGFR